MTEHEASRTLVKSPPELWAECSDAGSLARHLGEFGEIKITRLEPETAVAWEGARASGTVRIEPSAWGTRVTLTAQLEVEEIPDEPEPEPEPVAVEREPEPEAQPPSRGRLLRRVRALFRPEPVFVAPRPEPIAIEPVPPPEPEPAPEPVIAEPELDPSKILVAALDSLGQAHHRPFSRA